VSRRMAREHFHATLDRRPTHRFRNATGNTRLHIGPSRRQVAGDGDLEEPRHRDVYELARFWRRLDLWPFFEAEGPVLCDRREDMSATLGDRRQGRRARFFVAHARTHNLFD